MLLNQKLKKFSKIVLTTSVSSTKSMTYLLEPLVQLNLYLAFAFNNNVVPPTITNFPDNEANLYLVANQFMKGK